MKARKTTKTKTQATGKKTPPKEVRSVPAANGDGVTPTQPQSEATPPTATRDTQQEEQPKRESWEKAVPYAADVKAKGLVVPLEGPAGTFTVSHNAIKDAPKAERWLVTHAGSVVASHSQYWLACLDARHRALGKV